MSGGRELRLSLAFRQGQPCLRAQGWAGTELRELYAMTSANLSRRIAVLPSDLAENTGVTDLQPVAGRLVIEGDSVLFLPRFPFLAGFRYTLVVASSFDNWQSAERVTVEVPPTGGERMTTVLGIYPTSGRVPLNLLRLYIHFSAPMSEGWADRAVRVRREDSNEELHDVFLVGPELWDTERRRLTLLLDPGRIKRGLAPHEEVGYPLMEGVPVVTAVVADFRDAEGRPLQGAGEVRYEVGPALRVRVDAKGWRHYWPLAGSKDALAIDFDRPLDHALLKHCLWVEDELGKRIPGRAVIGPQELSWRFSPDAAWGRSGYNVAIDTRLEDLAGNSLTRVFDRDLSRTEDDPTLMRRVTVPFVCANLVTNP